VNFTEKNGERSKHWLSSHSDEMINRGPVCVRIQNIKHAL
jgi:hypothetical protein